MTLDDLKARIGSGLLSFPVTDFGPDGAFAASEVLAKHDETYMPPEVAEALKKSGRWREGAEVQ